MDAAAEREAVRRPGSQRGWRNMSTLSGTCVCVKSARQSAGKERAQRKRKREREREEREERERETERE